MTRSPIPYYLLPQCPIPFDAYLQSRPQPQSTARRNFIVKFCQRCSVLRFHITIPLISPVIFLNFIVGIINLFQTFTVAFIATRGGPINSSLFYVLYIYRKGFKSFSMGYASGLAWILFIIILVITAIQFYLSRNWVYYKSGGAPR